MRRLRPALVAVAGLLAACGADESPVVGGTVTTPPVAPPPVAAGTPEATSAPAPAPGAGPGYPAPDSGSGAGEPPSAGFPALDGDVAVGAFAPSLLRPDRSTRIVVEIHAAPDDAPARSTLDHLQATMAAATGKEVVLSGGGAPPAGSRWTSASIRDAADAGGRIPQGGGTAVLRLLFLPGTFEGDGDVLGVAVRGDTAAVFAEPVADAGASVLGDGRRVEAAVAVHELGHLLGLVDLYLRTGRADPERPGHSANRDSVMYFAVESGSALGLVFGPDPPTTFDDADGADLAAIASGA